MNCKCTGITLEDCLECHMFYSIHSEHYSYIYNEKITEINCSIGGYKTFDTEGEEKK